MSNLSEVSVMIKTFLRDAHLFDSVAAIRRTMPEVRLIVVDDGERSDVKSRLYDDLRSSGHVVIEMPFDSGFGAKSNAVIVPGYDRKYLLIGSDDFDFNPPSVRQGIERMVTVLEADVADIASGRVNGYPYEGWLRDYGDRIVEEYIKFDQPHQINGVIYFHCDLTVNYSLIKSDIFGSGPQQVAWDSDVKIGGGEHGAFFVDVMRAGYRVVYVQGVEIKEQANKPTDLRYAGYRGRATLPGRPCFARRGIKEYVMFGGGVEKP